MRSCAQPDLGCACSLASLQPARTVGGGEAAPPQSRRAGVVSAGRCSAHRQLARREVRMYGGRELVMGGGRAWILWFAARLPCARRLHCGPQPTGLAFEALSTHPPTHPPSREESGRLSDGRHFKRYWLLPSGGGRDKLVVRAVEGRQGRAVCRAPAAAARSQPNKAPLHHACVVCPHRTLPLLPLLPLRCCRLPVWTPPARTAATSTLQKKAWVGG